ncbi:ubiquitin-like protein Pup [Vallicoccus soli]|uniref:Prokaryotic ubiquitin-like protein Pup n=1 Tax=Vallicoccus soli TaxID=2339232 RepID=A0A3A3YR70_9ACTN|nr:ubiquitin-like protein Pup [Vallicoccus soli]RJK93205.1 ubiquitin-like protein Pup [Vallicoccus soli]
MPTRDTGGQARGRRSEDAAEVEEVATEEAGAAERAERKEKLDEDIDAILDEIDETLEVNSEEYVRSFVQKGGQ